MMTATLPRDIRITERQTAQLMGVNLGELQKLTGRGGRHFDPTFPPRENGTHSANAVLAWIAARDADAAPVVASAQSAKGSP